MASHLPGKSPDPSFFNGRFMIEIEEWNWALTVGLSHPLAIRRQRFQGGLMYVQSIVIDGRIRAPAADRGKPIQIWISTFGPKVRFNAKTGNVGRFQRDRLGEAGPPLEASLEIPEDALSNALICLGSAWKFLDIWTANDEAVSAVTAFSFSSSIHPNLVQWAGPELDAPRPVS